MIAIVILLGACGWHAFDVGNIERRKRKERSWEMPDIEDEDRLQ